MSKLDNWISNYKEILTMQIKTCILTKLPTAKNASYVRRCE